MNITYVDDGRVLDTPEDLKQAFEHAIQTEVALKGFEYLAEINLFRSKDGEVENLSGNSSDEDDEEMFACEICEVGKESDSSCPHCGAIFEDDEEDEEPTPRSQGKFWTTKRSRKKSVHLAGPNEAGHLDLNEVVHPEAPDEAVHLADHPLVQREVAHPDHPLVQEKRTTRRAIVWSREADHPAGLREDPRRS